MAEVPADFRQAAAFYLRTRDQQGMDLLALKAGLAGVDPEAYIVMCTEEMWKQDHATREWWGAPCNCEGNLN